MQRLLERDQEILERLPVTGLRLQNRESVAPRAHIFLVPPNSEKVRRDCEKVLSAEC
jgi:hypothetical protein